MPQRVDATAQVRRQDLLELDERADRRLLDPRHRGAGRGPQADRDRHRLVVVEQQRRHRRAGMQAVASGGTGDRIDRIAELAQPLDIAADRAARHAEPLRELVAGPVAARLQQGEQLQQAAGGLGHRAATIAEIAARNWPKRSVRSPPCQRDWKIR